MHGFAPPSTPPVSLDDFEPLRVIGKGSYGKVMLVRRKTDSRTYAMKILRKENIVMRNQVQHTKNERKVLAKVSYPFIVAFFGAFQTPRRLHMILEYCPGGELFFHLSRAGRFSERRCRFYSSELLLALEYLHRLSVVFRDLKPENVLLDAEGHVKLTDFGLSKDGVLDNFSAKTMCGTPEYLAPEILDKEGGGRAADWYSLGTLIYELATGNPPFSSEDRVELYQRKRQGLVNYPAYIGHVMRSLIEALLQRDPFMRLGGGPGDGAEVRAHEFFAGVDWPAVERREMRPPFRPELRGGEDLRYFDDEFLAMQVNTNDPMCNQEVHHFEGFTYVGDSTSSNMSE